VERSIQVKLSFAVKERCSDWH